MKQKIRFETTKGVQITIGIDDIYLMRTGDSYGVCIFSADGVLAVSGVTYKGIARILRAKAIRA